MRGFGLAALLALLGCDGEGKGQDSEALKYDADVDGYTGLEGDCDDEDPAVHPGADEIYCDQIDNDCDGEDYDDEDNDGYDCLDDCNDSASDINPGADDACGDGVDYDCSGDLECDCDGDDFDGPQCDGSDCDDGDATINPDALDNCYDGTDDDCSATDDYDCDLDGYASAEYGGDDCDDRDDTLSPGVAEVCNDGIDNDCTPDTPDCDCDGDGEGGAECGGTDCDDTDPEIGPLGDESTVNGADDDCDGETDEDAYCNVYLSTANGSSASLVYETLFLDGSLYTETVKINTWDAASGDLEISRTLSSSFSSYDISETWSCLDGLVTMLGYSVTVSSIPIASIVYTDARTVLLAESDLVPGATWTYAYDASDGSSVQYSAAGTFTVIGAASVTTMAGTFDALEITNDYVITGSASADLDREGTVTLYYEEKLGLVYSEDITTDGTRAEVRSLDSYSGYYP